MALMLLFSKGKTEACGQEHDTPGFVTAWWLAETFAIKQEEDDSTVMYSSLRVVRGDHAVLGSRLE